MANLITNSERKLDNYANSLNNYIVRGGQIKDIHIEKLKLNLNKFKLELDEIHNKTILSTKELSIIFGFSMSWITKMTSKKLIPFYKNSNGHCVFVRKDFEEWLINTDVLEEKFKEYEKLGNSKITNNQKAFEENLKNNVEDLTVRDDLKLFWRSYKNDNLFWYWCFKIIIILGTTICLINIIYQIL